MIFMNYYVVDWVRFRAGTSASKRIGAKGYAHNGQRLQCAQCEELALHEKSKID